MNFGRVMNHSIQIEPSENNGFFVTVGCRRFAYTDKKDLIADLETFLDDPERMEQEYNKAKGNVLQQEVCRARDEPDCVPIGNTWGQVLPKNS
jgi:Fe-S-cluster formation regulator IscX/YfhJ